MRKTGRSSYASATSALPARGRGDPSLRRQQLGTPDYVSPEQLKSSKHVDERADVWSLGATLYQMLCGAAPFAHVESVFDVMNGNHDEDVRPSRTEHLG